MVQHGRPSTTHSRVTFATSKTHTVTSTYSDTPKFTLTPSVSTSPSTLTQKTSNTKPLNVFYVWYSELCRRQNSSPICAIRAQSNRHEHVLDFNADRIKIEDWQPIINALRLDTSLHVISVHSRLVSQKFLEDADNEEKVKKIKKWFGAICTRYVMRNFLKALSCVLRHSEVLNCLELDGLKICGEYLEQILKAILANKTLKYLSFKCCPIEDEGCFEICNALHTLPNIENINLSSCGLGVKSGESISKLIKYQQINRYCESWHSSLRYADPEINNMAGIKRITINNNPKIGDEGLDYILNELIDDLWIKAIDMQRCNVSEVIAAKIIDTIDYSRSLEIFDFRNNGLTPSSLERILELLRGKQSASTGDYNWCYTSTTLDTQAYGTYTSLSNTKTNQYYKKPRLYSRQNISTHTTNPTTSLEKSSLDQKKMNKENINKELIKPDTVVPKPDNAQLIKAKEQLMQLYEKLKGETLKRQKAEKKCEELQNQVNELLDEQKNHLILKEFSNMKQYLNKFIKLIKENAQEFQENNPILEDLQNALREVQVLAKPYEINPIMSEDSIISSKSQKIVEKDKRLADVQSSISQDLKIKNLFQHLVNQSDKRLPVINKPSQHELFLDLSSIQNQNLSLNNSSDDSVGSLDTDGTLKRLLDSVEEEYEYEYEDDNDWVTTENVTHVDFN